MQELNKLNIDDELDNNDDMIAKEQDIDNSVSFKPSTDSAPKRSWTKSQIKSVWIIGVVATILMVICSFFLKDLNIFGIFA